MRAPAKGKRPYKNKILRLPLLRVCFDECFLGFRFDLGTTGACLTRRLGWR